MFAAAVLILGGAQVGLGSAQAGAAEVKVGGRPLAFDPPEGYCLFEKSRPREALAIREARRSVGPADILVWMAVDCAEKDRWSQQPTTVFDRAIAVSVTKRKAIVESAETMTRAEFIAEMARTRPWHAISKEFLENMTATGPRIRPGRISVLAKDEEAVYIGTTYAMFMHTATGRRWVAMVSVSAETVINQLPVSLEISGPSTRNTSLKNLLRDQKVLLRALIARNEPAAVEPPPAVEPPITADPLTTADPSITPDPSTTADPSITVAPPPAVEPLITVAPVTSAEPLRTVDPPTALGPPTSIKPPVAVERKSPDSTTP